MTASDTGTSDCLLAQDAVDLPFSADNDRHGERDWV